MPKNGVQVAVIVFTAFRMGGRDGFGLKASEQSMALLTLRVIEDMLSRRRFCLPKYILFVTAVLERRLYRIMGTCVYFLSVLRCLFPISSSHPTSDSVFLSHQQRPQCGRYFPLK
jgi:hypothetical protein